jgi:phage-related protein
MDKYRKAIASVVAATLVAVIPIVNAGPMTVTSELNIAIAFAGAVLVYLAPNVPKYSPVVKTSVAAVIAALSFIVTVLSADCSSLTQIFHCVSVVNWLQVGLIVLKVGGVYLIPNEKS